MTSKTVTKWVDVDVDVDITEFDEEDIVEHLQERGYVVVKSGSSAEEMEELILEMFYAFKLGRDERAMELARKIAQDHTGRIL